MITVTANEFHEKLNIGEDEVVLNGPPAFMTGNVLLSNNDEDTLFIRDLPLAQSNEGNNLPKTPSSFKFLTSLRPGEERSHKITYQLPGSTPPGIYDSTIQVGGQEKRVKMIVQPNIQVEIAPLKIHFQGVEAGKSYSTIITMSNIGNLPFRIPDIKHVNTLDEDYLCRALALAIRENGGEGFKATMDELTRNIHKEMTDWATVKLDESGRVIQPGEIIQLHFTLTLPRNVNPARDYFGDVRIWNKLISFNINSHQDYTSENKDHGYQNA